LRAAENDDLGSIISGNTGPNDFAQALVVGIITAVKKITRRWQQI
jgi:hypothetical protein